MEHKEYKVSINVLAFLYSLMDFIRPPKAKVPSLYVTMLEQVIGQVEDMESKVRNLTYDIDDYKRLNNEQAATIAELKKKLVSIDSAQFKSVMEAAAKRISFYTNKPAYDTDMQEVAKELILGNLIMAIKMFRACTGVGLKEAKESCEAIMYDDCKLKPRPTY